MTIQIIQYADKYKDDIIGLILEIQATEFKLPITRNDQPDLNQIGTFYQNGVGNFWLAVNDSGKVVGTIALIDIGNQLTALRKMFVAPDYRGKDKQVAQQLLNTLINWCEIKNIAAVYLGTVSIFLAAQRFYEKNGFREIPKAELPPSFPVMALDSKFYVRKIDGKL